MGAGIILNFARLLGGGANFLKGGPQQSGCWRQRVAGFVQGILPKGIGEGGGDFAQASISPSGDVAALRAYAASQAGLRR